MEATESTHAENTNIMEVTNNKEPLDGCNGCDNQHLVSCDASSVVCPKMFYRPEGHYLPRLTNATTREARRIVTLVWPVSCTHFLIFFIQLSSTFFLGRLGRTHLAGAGLALAITNVTGLSLAFGFSMGLDTLMNQAMGAKNFKRVGVLAQRSVLILGISLFPVFGLWLNVKPLLLAIKQHENVIELTEEFVLAYFPALAFNAFYQILEKFLVCQKLVRLLIASSLFGVVVNLGVNYLLVIAYPLGLRGGAIAINCAYLSMCLFLLTAIIIKGWHKKCWAGWSWECLDDWGEFAKFALPTVGMICIEWWSFELGTFVVGTLGEVQLAVQTIAFNLATTNFMISLGFSIAATVQVGRYLGAGRPEMALLSSRIVSIMTVLFVTSLMLVLFLIRNYIGYIFTSNREVIELTAVVIPFVAVFEILDGAQSVCSGIIRGAGMQRIGVIINFIGYDIIALPFAVVLALVVKMYIKGMWLGLGFGLLLQCIAFRVLITRLDWVKLSRKAVKRSSGEETMNGKAETELTELVKSDGGEAAVENKEHISCTGSTATAEDATEDQDGILLQTDEPMISQNRGREMLPRRILMFLASFSCLVVGIVVKLTI